VRTDAKQSAKSRVRVLNMLAEDRTRLLAYHFALLLGYLALLIGAVALANL
jgi:hypothetical protein